MDSEQRKRVLQTLQDDDLRDDGEALLRGELPADRSAALLASADSSARAIAELYKPPGAKFEADLAFKLTMMRRPRWHRQAAYTGASLAALMTVIAVPLLQRAPAYVQRQLDISSETAPGTRSGDQTMGTTAVAPGPEAKLVLGRCVKLRFVPKGTAHDRVDVRAFLQRGSELVPWVLQLGHDQETGITYQRGGCATPPQVAGGDWEAVMIFGQRLPDAASLERMIQARESVSPGAQYQVERKPVVLP